MKTWLKKIKHKLEVGDSFWAIPIVFILTFIIAPNLSFDYFKDPTYDTQWLHRGLLTVLLLMLFFFSSLGCIWFKFRRLYRYIYDRDSAIKEDFKNSPTWLKVCLPFFVFAFLVLAHMIIYQMLQK
jgi:cbb3-type cytochrome oxidase subunit 3